MKPRRFFPLRWANVAFLTVFYKNLKEVWNNCQEIMNPQARLTEHGKVIRKRSQFSLGKSKVISEHSYFGGDLLREYFLQRGLIKPRITSKSWAVRVQYSAISVGCDLKQLLLRVRLFCFYSLRKLLVLTKLLCSLDLAELLQLNIYAADSRIHLLLLKMLGNSQLCA